MKLCEFLRSIFLLVVAIAPAVGYAEDEKPPPPPIIGRWDLTVNGPKGPFPSWLEVTLSGRETLVGRYVGRVGSARPIAEVHFKDGGFEFTIPPQWEERKERMQTFKGTFRDDKLAGSTVLDDGTAADFSGVRAPKLNHAEPRKWSAAVSLLNGKDLSNWRYRDPNGKKWQIIDGHLVNAEPGNDIITLQKFTDFKVHVEFRYPEGSNSGIYLRGRYEAQIEDGFGKEPESHETGGIYGFLQPRINASRKAGEWQAYDITLVGRRVTVALNGEVVIDRQIIPGITGGALDSNEGEPGPLLIQGDHGKIEIRKLTVQLPEN